ncbi:hypothetical protein J6590_034600 [Homalodisca vitripennis]|nr:hypothetical protein J6590_034600 [Homalodisca vitripennis]
MLEERDNLEYEGLPDKYDNDTDPEYVPDEDDLVTLMQNMFLAQMIWRKQRQIRTETEVERPTTSKSSDRPNRPRSARTAQ